MVFQESANMNNTSKMKGQSGFTLIEIMVVVAILSILLAVALPSYRDYVLQGRLVDAHSGLSSGRLRAEQFYQDNRDYTGMPCPANTSNFTFACTGQTNAAFLITATGIGPASGFVLTINQDNTRATTGAPSGWATSNNCWIVSKSGC